MTAGAPFQPVYEDAAFAQALLTKLSVLPSLVEHTEIDALCIELAHVNQSSGLVLQAGPCAELLGDYGGEVARAGVAVLVHLAEVLAACAQVPVLPLLRGAGQFAKPRNALTETRAGLTLPSYAGDLVNARAFNAASRKPNPARLAWAYDEARRTLVAVRAAQAGARMFSSHEALHLAWEQAQLRMHGDVQYLQSAHSVWVGDKSRDPRGAHVALAASIANPVGVKVGPAATPRDVVALVQELNPARVPGRLTLVMRLGLARAHQLGPVVEAVRAWGVPVLWMCDPMHGNTRVSSAGRKLRVLDDMVAECTLVARMLAERGERLSGLHLEVAHDDVAECVGAGVGESDLHGELACDPRLNPRQAEVLVRAFAAAVARH